VISILDQPGCIFAAQIFLIEPQAEVETATT